MRRSVPWVLAAVALTGCTGGFPADSSIVAELVLGDLAMGARHTTNLTVGPGLGTLFVGMRTGPSQALHVTLLAPNGTRYDTARADPPGACVVRAPAPGTWTLEVHADDFDGFLRGGKFTVRVAEGAAPPVFPCVDDVFPGKGRAVTVALANVTLPPSGNATLPFAVEIAAAEVEAVARFIDPANATLDADANLTLNLTLPSGAVVAPRAMLLEPGNWTAVAARPGGNTTLQWLLAARAIGS